MLDPENLETLPANGTGRSRRKAAQGIFPRLPLSKALELALKIFELGEGEPVRRLTVFDRMNRSPENGSSRTLITVSNSGYGLTTGGYSAEFLGLTERGRKIVTAQNVYSKHSAVYDALFENEVFSDFLNQFQQRGIPRDETAIDHLTQKHSLSPHDARICWSVIKENAQDYPLTKELSGKTVLISRAMALETLTDQFSENLNDADSGAEAPLDQPEFEKGGSKGKMTRNQPQIHFNIQVHLPENSSPDTYEAIFKSISTYLLGRDED